MQLFPADGPAAPTQAAAEIPPHPLPTHPPRGQAATGAIASLAGAVA